MRMRKKDVKISKTQSLVGKIKARPPKKKPQLILYSVFVDINEN